MTLATTRTTSTTPVHCQTITRALSSLTGIFTVPHQVLNCHCPKRRKEREGLGHPGARRVALGDCPLGLPQIRIL